MRLPDLDFLDAVAVPADAVEVGKIAQAWGVKGWFKIHPHSASPEALFSCRRWLLLPTQIDPAATGSGHLSAKLLRIRQAKHHGDVVVAQAEDVVDRELAEQLKGWRVFVPRSSFPTLPDGEFYWVDLMGLSVVNHQGETLGTVTDLISTGPQTVLVLKPTAAKSSADTKASQILIPFVDAYIGEVNLDKGIVFADWQADY